MPFKSKKQRGSEKYPNGGMLNGPPHEGGGIPIEAEGGEFIIQRNSVNGSTLDMLEYINQHGDLPLVDARDRGRE